VLEGHLQEIQALHEQLREQANRDALTGLHNRRYLDSTLERETARCEREGEALSLILLDVDHFKSYNDHYGHQAGDAALQRVADALTASVKRASDLVARYGGEEFVVVLPDVDAPAAMTLADTMRRAVETLNIPHVRSPYGRVTISLGVATKEAGRREAVERLIRVADGALYRAKQSGRNQVQEGLACFDDPTVAGGLARLVWTATYECDQPLIDDQHRSLFAQINRLLGAINSGESRETLTLLVTGLLEAVATHFRDEEAIFTGAGYPGSEAHVASHRDLLERATSIADDFHRDEESIGEMFRFLAQDLVARHFLAADREFFPYLHATAKAASA
jgi:diguanylate cyclase (GGDEF)-like protein/hemerythrin-like metal-binding protein